MRTKIVGFNCSFFESELLTSKWKKQSTTFKEEVCAVQMTFASSRYIEICWRNRFEISKSDFFLQHSQIMTRRVIVSLHLASLLHKLFLVLLRLFTLCFYILIEKMETYFTQSFFHLFTVLTSMVFLIIVIRVLEARTLLTQYREYSVTKNVFKKP